MNVLIPRIAQRKCLAPFCYRSFASTQQSGHHPSDPSTLSFEYVQSLDKLPLKEQDFLIHETYKLFLTSLRGLQASEWKEILLDKTALANKIMLIKENKFQTYVGFSFYHIYDFFHRENDKNRENRYVTSTYYIAVMPNFRGKELGRAILESTEYLTQQEYPDCNRVSFNITLNPFYYNLRSHWTEYMVPGVKQMKNNEPEKLLQKIIKELNYKCVSPDKPYVITIEDAHITGADPEKYLKKSEQSSAYTQFYLSQTGLGPGLFLANLAIYNLVENNTLALDPGTLKTFSKCGFEVNEYLPRHS